MSSGDELRQAIDAARAGRRQEARERLLKIVDDHPQNEAAWIWLSGLVDSLEDQIIACENALTINPHNEKVRSYLSELRDKREAQRRIDHVQVAQELFAQAKNCAESGDVENALRLAEQAAQSYPDSEDVWLLIADLSPYVGQRIMALEKAHEINPRRAGTLLSLEKARQFRDDPLSAAAHYEQMGQLDKALDLYNQLAAKTKDAREFDKIYRTILRIEALKKEKIRYVSPRTSILRLAFGWPLLYLFLAMVQVGLNPFKHPVLYVWLGLPVVALGSFLLSLSEVRSRHALWQKLFSEKGDGSSFARFVAATAGWTFVIFPHLLLLIDSINRLSNLRIPPEPF